MNKIHKDNKEQMKTNQTLTVKLGLGFGEIHIGHKDKMVSGQDVIRRCNDVVKVNNEDPLDKRGYLDLSMELKKSSLWKLAIEIHLMKKYDFINPMESVELNLSKQGENDFNKDVETPQSGGLEEEKQHGGNPHNLKENNRYRPVKNLTEGRSSFEEYVKERTFLYNLLSKRTNSKSQVNYSDLIKYTDRSIVLRKHKAPDGKFYKSIFIDLYILLEFASKVSVRLKVIIYKAFVESGLFKKRDKGGILYKSLSIHIRNSFGDGENGKNHYVLANLVKEFIKPKDMDWNKATEEELDRRVEFTNIIITILSFMNENTHTFNELLEVLKKAFKVRLDFVVPPSKKRVKNTQGLKNDK